MPLIRKAVVSDVKKIHRMINSHAEKALMLPRPLNELYEHIRDFHVSVENGRIQGLCALHVMWEDLGEIRSLVVAGKARKQGIGRKLVNRCLTEAKRLGLKRVFALTYTPDFFTNMGFREIDKAELPHKIWSDCMRCPKFPDCDEFAVIRDL